MAMLPSTDDMDNNSGEEGAIFTIPKYKKYKSKPIDDIDFQNNDKDIIELKQFVQKYKLHKLAKKLLREGITINFLLSQNDTEIDAIAKELTVKSIQQNKLKFAVCQEKKINLLLIKKKKK
eukprot:863143_1